MNYVYVVSYLPTAEAESDDGGVLGAYSTIEIARIALKKMFNEAIEHIIDKEVTIWGEIYYTYRGAYPIERVALDVEMQCPYLLSFCKLSCRPKF